MTRSIKTVLMLSAGAVFMSPAQATPPGFNEPGMGQMPVRAQGDMKPRRIQDWWPERVDLSRLRQNGYDAAPDEDFDYAEEFARLDLDAVKADIAKALTDSKEWWPADYGSYTGLFIRLAWHSAGTYRSGDGRGGSDGGQIRFEPLNSWPDNGNLDKARRLLWPVKAKYGRALSWSDLIVLSGNVALEQAGFETFGFAGGREDDWEPELVYWGPESKFLTSQRFKGESEGNAEGSGEIAQDLGDPLGASEMGLIYVNPEGPGGNPDILASAQRIRTTFGRMGMNDEETVALIVGGHTLGKVHGAHKASDCVGPEPAAAPVEQQGFGWKNSCGTGVGPDAVTSGLEGAWTGTPVTWSRTYIQNLYAFDWKLTRSPAGAKQWVPTDEEAKFVPDAYDPETYHPPMMLTTDLALRYDPAYGKITQRWLENPEEMEAAFARAWFKLTHRDMGPRARYVGSEVPAEKFVWQDPLPEATGALVDAAGIARLENRIAQSGLSNSELVKAAWAAAVTYRDTDMRGGANGSRIRLAPQKDWAVNDPETLAKVVETMKAIQADFNAGSRRKVSIADLVVLGGKVAIERAAKAAGHSIDVPFTPGRVDATQEMTDPEAMENLRPAADGFRNFYGERARLTPTEMLIERADLLTLTVPETAVLVAGMRALDANAGGSRHGVLTDTPGTLTNDFFVNLLDMGTRWAPADGEEGVYEGRDRETDELKWTATEVDLVFGSNSELRAVAEHYAYADGQERFIEDFADAWAKVMRLDRFDLR